MKRDRSAFDHEDVLAKLRLVQRGYDDSSDGKSRTVCLADEQWPADDNAPFGNRPLTAVFPR